MKHHNKQDLDFTLFACISSSQCGVGWAGNGYLCGSDIDIDDFPDEKLNCPERNCNEASLSHFPPSFARMIASFRGEDFSQQLFIHPLVITCTSPQTKSYFPFRIIASRCQTRAKKMPTVMELETPVTTMQMEMGSPTRRCCNRPLRLIHSGFLVLTSTRFPLQDNCVLVPNVDQRNVDEDDFGDACDNCRGVKNDDQKDTDVDKFGDECDEDIDGDGRDWASALTRPHSRQRYSSVPFSCQGFSITWTTANESPMLTRRIGTETKWEMHVIAVLTFQTLIR